MSIQDRRSEFLWFWWFRFFHIALEEYRPSSMQNAKKANRLRSASHELFLFSASSSSELLQKLQQNYVPHMKDNLVFWLAQQSLTEFSVQDSYRATLICSDIKDAEQNTKIIEHIQNTPQKSLTTPNGFFIPVNHL